MLSLNFIPPARLTNIALFKVVLGAEVVGGIDKVGSVYIYLDANGGPNRKKVSVSHLLHMMEVKLEEDGYYSMFSCSGAGHVHDSHKDSHTDISEKTKGDAVLKAWELVYGALPEITGSPNGDFIDFKDWIEGMRFGKIGKEASTPEQSWEATNSGFFIDTNDTLNSRPRKFGDMAELFAFKTKRLWLADKK